MSQYVFRIHEATEPAQVSPTPAANVHGWAKTGHISGALLNNIKVGTVNSKMGTAIPSLFARLYLFEGAFQTLKGASIYELQTETNNTALISECFDLLEFLFQRGNDRNLIIRNWNAQQQIQLLEADGDARHAKLARVIKDEIAIHPQFNNLYLFYWRTTINSSSVVPEELLIGGTSPLTLVFTSPNWKRIIKDKGLSFSRLDGTALFSTISKSLVNRDEKFKRMIYRAFMAYQQQFAHLCPSFESYIQTCWASEMQDPKITSYGGNSTQYIAKYPSLKDENGASVYVGGIPLSYEQITLDGSGYQIRCSSNRYANYSYNGTKVNLDKKPLVLNEHGINGAPYVGASRWDPQTCTINDAATRGVPLHERRLPGQMGIKSPYVIWSDFLEDRIIKTSYVLDGAHFVTATNNDITYLLPLKKEFFNFFNIEDLTKVIATEGDKDLHLMEIVQGDDFVEVTLNIPVEYNNSIVPLKKVYKGESIVYASGFVLGCFPFYKVVDNGQLNRYAVLNCGNSSELSFFNVQSVENPIACSSMVRTQGQKMIEETKYYDVKESFDFIRVTIIHGHGVTTNGLVVPAFKEIVVGNASRHYSFAVDFGTSNTYIAYNTQLNPIPVTFEYGGEDAQSIYLNKGTLGEDPRLQHMPQFFNREFSPVEIGHEKLFEFPMRTATCETTSFENNIATLFGNISAGFNFLNETAAFVQSSFVYKTGLKWALESNPDDAKSRDRVRNYFLQLLWMLKNKVLLNDGVKDFDLFITFPESMKVPTRNLFINQCWMWAAQQLGLTDCKIHYGSEVSESIAPYNKLAPVIGGSDMINIDIGGGTSDILIVTKQNGKVEKAYYSSTKFAADDLWGDGLDVGIKLEPKNGFLRYVKENIDSNRSSYDSRVTNQLDTILNLTNSSADAMGFLFKYDSVFGASNLIVSQANLYSLIFVHYSAIMYYIARLIKKLHISIPENISFTGMGSRYIRLISTNVNDIEGLTRLLLESYTGLKAPLHFKVFMEAESKEVTAKGALMGAKLSEAYQILSNQLHKSVDYGFDSDTSLTYGEVTNAPVKASVISENRKFIDSLQSKEIANYVYQKFGLSISKYLLDALLSYADSSYENMCASIPDVHSTLDVEETLFFWPLKLALPQVSENYLIY